MDRPTPAGADLMRAAVVMTVEHQLGAVRLQNPLDEMRIDESATELRLAWERRMVDDHDPRVAIAAEQVERSGEGRKLRLANAADGIERRRRDRGVDADEREPSQQAHIRKACRGRLRISGARG